MEEKICCIIKLPKLGGIKINIVCFLAPGFPDAEPGGDGEEGVEGGGRQLGPINTLYRPDPISHLYCFTLIANT